MSDAIITAREAYELAHKKISKTFDKVNSSIEAAIDQGEFTCHVFLTDAEYNIASRHFGDYRVQKLERTGSLTYRYLLDFSEPQVQ